MKGGVTIIAINMKNQDVLSKMMEPSYVSMAGIFIKQLKNNAPNPSSSRHASSTNPSKWYTHNMDPNIPEQTSNQWDKKKVALLITLVFSYILIAIVFYLVGKNTTTGSQMEVIEQQTTFVTTSPLPTLEPTIPTSPTSAIKAFDQGSMLLSVCGYPRVELPEPGASDVECLDFDSNGNIRKTLNNEFQYYDSFSSQEKENVLATVKTIRTELSSEAYKTWLETPKLPVTGATNDVIVAYHLYGEQDIAENSETEFTWGLDSSPESLRLKEIHTQLFDYLK